VNNLLRVDFIVNSFFVIISMKRKYCAFSVLSEKENILNLYGVEV